MGKTFRRNEGRRPKWDKRGKKSHKIHEFEDGKFKPRHYRPSEVIDAGITSDDITQENFGS